MLPTKTNLELNKLIKKIARLTDINNHNESVLTLAKHLNDTNAIEAMEAIMVKHKRAGGMESEWIDERVKIRKGLMNRVTFLYGEEINKKINGAF